jgi:hypothetical protein
VSHRAPGCIIVFLVTYPWRKTLFSVLSPYKLLHGVGVKSQVARFILGRRDRKNEGQEEKSIEAD